MLNLQNKNLDPLKSEIAYVPIKKRKGNSIINDEIKCNLYAWITCHPQVVQSSISNDCLKVIFDDQKEPQLVPKLLIQVSVRDMHNRLVSGPHDDGIKDASDEDDNIIISDSVLH